MPENTLRQVYKKTILLVYLKYKQAYKKANLFWVKISNRRYD